MYSRRPHSERAIACVSVSRSIARVIPTYASRRSSSIPFSSIDRACGKIPSSIPIISTCRTRDPSRCGSSSASRRPLVAQLVLVGDERDLLEELGERQRRLLAGGARARRRRAPGGSRPVRAPRSSAPPRSASIVPGARRAPPRSARRAAAPRPPTWSDSMMFRKPATAFTPAVPTPAACGSRGRLPERDPHRVCVRDETLRASCRRSRAAGGSRSGAATRRRRGCRAASGRRPRPDLRPLVEARATDHLVRRCPGARARPRARATARSSGRRPRSRSPSSPSSIAAAIWAATKRASACSSSTSIDLDRLALAEVGEQLLGLALAVVVDHRVRGARGSRSSTGSSARAPAPACRGSRARTPGCCGCRRREKRRSTGPGHRSPARSGAPPASSCSSRYCAWFVSWYSSTRT